MMNSRHFFTLLLVCIIVIVSLSCGSSSNTNTGDKTTDNKNGCTSFNVFYGNMKDFAAFVDKQTAETLTDEIFKTMNADFEKLNTSLKDEKDDVKAILGNIKKGIDEKNYNSLLVALDELFSVIENRYSDCLIK